MAVYLLIGRRAGHFVCACGAGAGGGQAGGGGCGAVSLAFPLD